MKRVKKTSEIVIPKHSHRLWKVYQQLEEMATDMDRLSEAGEVQVPQIQSVPQELLPMVF